MPTSRFNLTLKGAAEEASDSAAYTGLHPPAKILWGDMGALIVKGVGVVCVSVVMCVCVRVGAATLAPWA